MKLRLPGYRRHRVVRGVTVFTRRRPMERFETDAPWLTFRFRWTDFWTRVLGRSGVEYECLICGGHERLTFRIPRSGPVPTPEGGQHPARLEMKAKHAHPGKRGNPLDWALPLGNPAALQGREAGLLDIVQDRVSPPDRSSS